MYPELFHHHRLHDPFRQAEKRVFQALARSEVTGFAYYEWQRNRKSRPAMQLDFAIWLEGIGRFGLQVKGGYYKLESGAWYRRKGRRGDYERVAGCPLAITADAALSLLKEVSEGLDKSTFVIPVLSFPNMQPDEAICKRAERSNVHLVWGTDRLVDRLAEIAREARVLRPPDTQDIRMEVEVLTDGQVSYGSTEPDVDGAPKAGGEPTAQVPDFAGPDLLIHHLRRVQVRLAPGHGETTSNKEDRPM